MTPVSPVLLLYPHWQETIIAKDQKEYVSLPVVCGRNGMYTSRWRLSWRERFRLLLSGDLYLQQLTYNSGMQPIKLSTEEPGLTEVLNDEDL